MIKSSYENHTQKISCSESIIEEVDKWPRADRKKMINIPRNRKYEKKIHHQSSLEGI